MNITAFTQPVTDLTTALVSAVPTLATAAIVIAGGLIALRVGLRVVRGFAK